MILENVNDLINSCSYIYSSYSKRNNIYIFISLFIIMFIFLFITFYPYYKFKNVIGIVNDNNIILYLTDEEISKLDSKKLYFNEQYQDYNISYINSNYEVFNNKIVKQVLIKTKMKDKQNINNNIVNLKFVDKKSTLLSEVIKNIKKGIVNG